MRRESDDDLVVVTSSLAEGLKKVGVKVEYRNVYGTSVPLVRRWQKQLVDGLRKPVSVAFQSWSPDKRFNLVTEVVRMCAADEEFRLALMTVLILSAGDDQARAAAFSAFIAERI